MEARRYRNDNQPDVNISNRTLPGVIILAAGLVVVIVGGILMAVLGVPTDTTPVTEYPLTIVGPIVLAVGLLLFVIGLGYTVHLKYKAENE